MSDLESVLNTVETSKLPLLIININYYLNYTIDILENKKNYSLNQILLNSLVDYLHDYNSAKGFEFIEYYQQYDKKVDDEPESIKFIETKVK